jgi:hypothetical protein
MHVCDALGQQCSGPVCAIKRVLGGWGCVHGIVWGRKGWLAGRSGPANAGPTTCLVSHVQGVERLHHPLPCRPCFLRRVLLYVTTRCVCCLRVLFVFACMRVLVLQLCAGATRWPSHTGV